MEYGYLRQSLDAEGDRDAVTRQREDLEALDLPPVDEWFVDNDLSAKSLKPRPDFERLLRTVQPGDRVRLVRVDRLVRRPMDLERLIEKADKGVTVQTLAGTLRLDTAEGRLYARVLVAFAASEVETHGERRQRKNLQRASRGLPHWAREGGRVFGYRREGDHIATDPGEAAALTKALEDICAGKTLAAVVREMNAAGFRTTARTRAGDLAPISYTTLRKWLLNPRYAGVNVHRSQQFEAVWPPLWDDEAAARVATLLKATDRRRSLSTRPKHLLSSIMVCGVCERGIVSTEFSGGTYRCQGAHVTRKRELCDWYAEVQLLGWLSSTEHPETDPVDETERRVRAAEIEELSARLDAIAEMVGEGLLKPEKAKEQARKLRARLDALESEPLPTLATSRFGRAAHAAEAWGQLDMPQRRRLLRQETQSVVLVPFGRGPRATRENPGVRIVWRDGSEAQPLPADVA